MKIERMTRAIEKRLEDLEFENLVMRSALLDLGFKEGEHPTDCGVYKIVGQGQYEEGDTVEGIVEVSVDTLPSGASFASAKFDGVCTLFWKKLRRRLK